MQAFLRRLTFVLLDIFLISLTLYLAFVIKHGVDDLPNFKLINWIIIWSVALVTSIAVNYFTGLYRNLWQYASINELLNVLASSFITEALFFVAMLLIRYKISYSVHFLILVFNTVFLGVS